MRFKILQMDAGGEAVLGWVKGESRRLVEAGNRSFNKTWTRGSATIRARCVEFMGDILVKLWITVATQSVIVNRLARAYDWRLPVNFKLVTPTASAPAAWYDTVTAVMLPALTPSTTFTVGAATLLPPTGLLKAVAIVEAFRKHVVAGHQAATRHWFGVLQRYLVLRFTQRDFATSDTDMLASIPDSAGHFYLLWGFWSRVIGEPFDPLTPGNDQFTGLIVSSVDLGLQAAQSLTNVVDFDKPVTTPGYVGPQRLGDGFQVYRRAQLGLFPSNAVDLVPPLRYRYRPDFVGSTGSPYATAYFDRKGVSLGNRAETWTYTFERHKLSSIGAIVVESISLPSLATPTTAVSNGTFATTRAASFSNFSADVVFFDGQDFVKIGSHQQTQTQDVWVAGVETSFIAGTASVSAAFESASVAFSGTKNPRIGFDYLLPDIGAAYVGNPAVGSEHVVVNLASRAAAFSGSTDRSIFANSTFIEDFPRLPTWGAGPSWGNYQHVKPDGLGGQSGFFNEIGFTCAGFAPGDPTSGVPAIGRVQTMSVFRPQGGVFWLRPDGTTGIFIYRLIGGIAADALKYRNIASNVVGFRQYRGPDGTLYTEPQWEDPTAILTRIMSLVRVDLNNFGTPAMIPWLEDEPDLVIVDA